MPTLDDDIGRMSHGLRDNAKDLFDIWMYQPGRRTDFGPRELLDIRETTIALQVLLREIDKQSALKVVNG
jgi:hypothetical protein